MKKIVFFNQILTILFVVSAIVAAVLFSDLSRAYIVTVSLFLFAVGVATFLLGYFTAVQRSREAEISVTQLFFLSESVAPSHIRFNMLGCLVVQVVVGLGVALARPSTDGKSGSVLAFCVMVPMLGLGLNGLWSAKFGSFQPRQLKKDPAPVADGDDSANEE